jgi:hypothetical protein
MYASLSEDQIGVASRPRPSLLKKRAATWEIGNKRSARPGGHRAGTARMPHIKVISTSKPNGIVNVSGRDIATGKEQAIPDAAEAGRRRPGPWPTDDEEKTRRTGQPAGTDVAPWPADAQRRTVGNWLPGPDSNQRPSG